MIGKADKKRSKNTGRYSCDCGQKRETLEEMERHRAWCVEYHKKHVQKTMEQCAEDCIGKRGQ